MATAVTLLTFTVLMFVEFGVLACSALGSRRRSRFYLRLGSASLVMLALAAGVAVAVRLGAVRDRELGPLWLGLSIAALAVGPVFCYHPFKPFRGSSDSDGDGGPSSGPPPPRPPEPRGGAPLPDADQSRTRRRDHDRPRLRDVSRRRPAVEPTRPRTPAEPRRR